MCLQMNWILCGLFFFIWFVLIADTIYVLVYLFLIQFFLEMFVFTLSFYKYE